MKKILILLSITLVFHNIICQKIVKTNGEGTAELTSVKSRMDAMGEAKEMAIVDALEKAFGRVIVQGNSTYLSNVNTGEKTETNTVFNMIANTSVKGEVVEILDEQYTDIKDKSGMTFVTCKISLKAKELTTPPVEFTALTLKCPDENCATTTYIDGEDFFMYFTSPVSGYLSVFLDDGSNTQLLLPYSRMPIAYENGFPVFADKEYILFSRRSEHYMPLDQDYMIDSYQLFAEKQEDLNRIFVLFSKEPLNKPKLKEDLMDKQLSDIERNRGFIMPKATDSEEFQKWLIKNRGFRASDLQVGIIDISIRK